MVDNVLRLLSLAGGSEIADTIKVMLSDLRKLWAFRGLISSLVIRDLRIKYQSSVLGFFWSLLHPLMMMSVYAIIFSILIRQVVDGPYPIFLLAGLLPWLFFSTSLTMTAPSLIINGSLINKVYFPRETLPLAIILSNLINFLLSLVVLFLFLIVFGIRPGLTLLLVPIVIFFHVLFIFGLSLFLSIANVYFRDITHVVEIVLQLWFFSVPVIYSIEFLEHALGSRWLMLYSLNPMVLIITMYRSLLMYSRVPSLTQWLVLATMSLVFFAVGYRFFKRREFAVIKEI